jgi:plastocyanin
MKARIFRWFTLVTLSFSFVLLATFAIAQEGKPAARQIIVPGEDRFSPYAVTVRVGQTVQFVNNDSDDHLVISVDAFNTAGHRGAHALLKGNGGTLNLTFNHAGVFPFYCGFHAMLDSHNQPIAPGPDGGIQDPNGNFGTPMNGVITVVEGTN